MTAAELLGMAQSEGVALALADGRLIWTAEHQPPADLLSALSAHKVELIAALAAANDAQPASEPRRTAWPITRGGKPIGYMVGPPITYAEALAEARGRWPDADILEN